MPPRQLLCPLQTLYHFTYWGDEGPSLVAQFLHAHVPPRQQARALNGAVVGLAARAPDAACARAGGPGLKPCVGAAPHFAPGSEQAARSRVQQWAPCGGGAGLLAEVGVDVGSQPGPGDLECLGVGLVRAVDAAARRVYLLTPLAPQELQRVSVLLVRSGCQVPYRPYRDKYPLQLSMSPGSGLPCALRIY